MGRGKVAEREGGSVKEAEKKKERLRTQEETKGREGKEKRKKGGRLGSKEEES